MPLACDGEDGLSNTCNVNADCVDSQAAKDIEPIRCGPKDLYCLEGTCHGECRELCEVVRDDMNPCSEPRHCVRQGDSSDALSFCTIMPIPCDTADDCPAYRTVLPEGGQGEWSCDDEVCRYPGVEYATQ
jgi:hypothetical protein